MVSGFGIAECSHRGKEFDCVIDEAIKRLSGIKCGAKPTSCPDQLAKALEQIKESESKSDSDSASE